MGGLLSGLLSLLALPPLQLNGFAVIWLVPWLITLRNGGTVRWLQSAPVVLIPVAWALGPALISEPLPSLALLVALSACVAIITTLGTHQDRGFGPLRLVLGSWLFIAALAVAREIGVPLSLAVFAIPAPWAITAVGAFGILGTDLLIMTFQTLLATALTEIWRAQTMPRGLVFITTAQLLALFYPEIANTASTPLVTETRSIAAIQTSTHPVGRDFLVSDGGLEKWQTQQERLREQAQAMNAEWWIWPESAIPGYLTTLTTPTVSSGPTEIAHGYIYQAPGELESVAIVSQHNHLTTSIKKRRPLPGAEHYLSKANDRSSIAEIDGVRVGVLICSDALNRRAVDHALSQGAQVLINPLNSAYIAHKTLAQLHQDTAHLQAARTGMHLLLVGNGGPTVLLRPDGPSRVLVPFYEQGVARVEIPVALQQQSPAHAPWLIAGLLAMSAGMTASVRLSEPRGQPTSNQPALGALLLSCLIVVASLSLGPTPAAPPLKIGFASVTPTSGLSHQGAIALIARAFGHPVHWSDIPHDIETAMTWLCQSVGIRPSSSTRAQDPGYGVLHSQHAMLAVRYEPRTGAVTFDPRSGRFSAAKNATDQIQWLRAVQTAEECHSAR